MENTRIDFLLALLIFSAFLGFFWSVFLLFNKRGHRVANQLLGFLMLFLALHVFKHVAFQIGLYFMTPALYVIAHSFTFFFGPLFFLYINAVLGKPIQRRDVYTHIVPGIVLLLTLSVLITKIALERKYENTGPYPEVVPGIILSGMVMMILHLLIYNIRGILTLNRFSKALKDQLSNLGKLNFSWLKLVTIGYSILLMIFLAYYIMLVTGGYYQYNQQIDFVFVLSIALFINLIAFKTLQVPELFLGHLTNEIEKPKYQGSTLSESDAHSIKLKLEQYMELEKPYLDHELKLKDLADQLSINPHHLSQTINEQMGHNFFEFINRYRIIEAKDKIINADWEKDTMLGIGLDVGFNSKTAFNRAFKKHSGQTPSDFRKLI